VGTVTACGSDKADSSGRIEVVRPAIPEPAEPDTAAVRMVIENGTGTDDALVAVSSPDATAATVHRSTTDVDGRSTMVAVPRLALPAHGEVAFTPGGLHVMLTGLKRELRIGNQVRLVLTFEHAGRRTIEVPVISASAQAAAEDAATSTTTGSGS
jgi:copper(I)-binding protein